MRASTELKPQDYVGGKGLGKVNVLKKTPWSKNASTSLLKRRPFLKLTCLLKPRTFRDYCFPSAMNSPMPARPSRNEASRTETNSNTEGGCF